jgi:hypothetical protein
MAQFCTECMPKYIGTKKALGNKLWSVWWNHDEGICEGCVNEYLKKKR